MADNTALNTMSGGDSVRDKDRAGVKTQIVMLDLQDGAGAESVVNGNLPVDVARIQRQPFAVTVTSAGLTTAATAYVAGDMAGTQWTFAGMAAASGGQGLITGCTIRSNSLQPVNSFLLYLFDRSVTQAADNAANSWSDADMAFCQAILEIPPMKVSALNLANSISFAQPYKCNATSLFGGLVSVGAIAATPFAAATDMTITLFGYQDQ